eukprot:jgi/Mesen1/9782/ME000007S09842
MKYGSNNGPTIWPLVGCTPALLVHKEHVHDWVGDMVKKYGTWRMVIPGLTRYFTTDPQNVEYILKDQFTNFPKGPVLHEFLLEFLGEGIFNVDGDKWRIQRKTASYEFSTRSLRELMVKSFREEAQGRLLPCLEEAARAGTPVDLQDIFSRYTFDSICLIGFGTDPRSLTPGLPVRSLARAFDDTSVATIERTLAPLFVYKLQRLLGVGLEGVLKSSLAQVDRFIAETIAARRKEFDLSGPRVDLLSRFMRLQLPGEGGQAPSDKYLRDLVTNFVLAGRDTSAVALTWFFWCLSQSPAAEEAIYREMQAVYAARVNPPPTFLVHPPPAAGVQGADASGRNGAGAAAAGAGTGAGAAGEKQAPFTPDELDGTPPLHTAPGARAGADLDQAPFTYDELKGMPYLHAALSEAMRLYPPVPINFKYVQADDTLPDGTRVPAGTNVCWDSYAMARTESVWGPDCAEFRPDRWLRDGQFVPASPFKYPVFNAGPRTCLGKDMAYLLMKIVATSVLKRYRVHVSPSHAQARYKISITLFMAGGLPVTLTRRAP